MDPAVIAFLAAAQVATPQTDIPEEVERVWTIGSTPASAELISGLIKQGEKTGTFHLANLTAEWPEAKQPVLGGYGVITDASGAPQVLVRTSSLEDVPYEDITEAHVQIDGPAMRVLAAWQDVHWPYFSNLMTDAGQVMTAGEPVTIETWDIVYHQD